jgi:hypothetical protein
MKFRITKSGFLLMNISIIKVHELKNKKIKKPNGIFIHPPIMSVVY